MPERVEQAHIVQLLRTLRGDVYVIGTRRRKGDFQGTMQTPGIPDLLAFLPDLRAVGSKRLLFVECKAEGGRLRPEQNYFRALCGGASIAHVTGTLNAVIAWAIAEGYVREQDVPHYRRPNGASKLSSGADVPANELDGNGSPYPEKPMSTRRRRSANAGLSTAGKTGAMALRDLIDEISSDRGRA